MVGRLALHLVHSAIVMPRHDLPYGQSGSKPKENSVSSTAMVSIDAYSGKATCERLLWVHRWTDKLLSFRTTRPAGYRFTAGQFARLGLEIDGEVVSRA